ncbi:MAG TPA: VWA domain-containing protein [Gammaproteobacteria bacterium]|jgi:Ca-activated chloride channel family protein|nr:VWA domain-containing protein [Gammaproteobacteria bacterium]
MQIFTSNNVIRLLLLLTLSSILTACATKTEEVSASAPAPYLSHSGDNLGEILVTASKQSGNSSRYAAQQPVSNLNYSPEIEFDRSEYPNYTENPIKITSEEPVSTFSIDVDTSSYSLMRSQIENGALPPHEAIRTEELLNYFDYDYPVPESKDQPFLATVNVFDSPWSAPKHLLRIGIKGYDIDRTQQPDSNLVFLFDVSGSMDAENKLPLVKKSFRLLLKSLKPTDTVAMVVYAGASGVVLQPTKVKNRTEILSALNRLSAGGSTAGGAGLSLAYELANENFNKDSVNRIIMATDGDFNVGQSSNEQLIKIVEKNRNAGIYLSVLGFGGYNYQDDMMQAIAQNGNGVAAYIDTLQEAKKVLVDEATSHLFPIANDVKIQIEFNPKHVAEYRLVGYETRVLAREDFNNDKVDAGEIGAGHSVTALYEITPTNTDIRSVDPLRYASQTNTNNEATPTPESELLNDELGFLKLRYKLPGAAESLLITQPILNKENTETDKDALFAASVAAFSEILRGGKHLNNFCLEDVIKLAKQNKGVDKSGYRAEFIQLVEMAKLLDDSPSRATFLDCKK